MLQTLKFARKTFYIDAVQVTNENMADVAEWCHGKIRTAATPKSAIPAEKHIKVEVYHPATDRQTMAFIGDWVLYAGTGFKVYTHKTFENSFQQVSFPPEIEYKS